MTLKLERLEPRDLLSYAVTDLGTLGGSESAARAVNDAGQVAGVSYLPSDESFRAALWDGGNPTNLGAIHGPDSEAFGLNNNGWVVGKADTNPRQNLPHAFLWHDGAMEDLGTFGGPFSSANAVNDAGQVVGSAFVDDITYHAFTWQDGQMTELDTLGGSSEALGVNADGVVAGTSMTCQHFHPVLWDDGAILDQGVPKGFTDAAIWGLNSSGLAVGHAWGNTDGSHAVQWRDGIASDLGTLGGANSLAFAANEDGLTVGYAQTATGVNHATLWNDKGIQDLNALTSTPGWLLREARGINNVGQIVGEGLNPQGETHAFLLTPDPGSSPGWLGWALHLTEKKPLG